MALERKDRVKDTTATTGTGTVTIDGTAITGYRTITSAHTTGATVRYVINNGTLTEWEVGEGVWTAAGTTLTRVTVYASSNAGALVSFSAGTKTVTTTPTVADIEGAAVVLPQGRVTLTTAVPVTSADVTAATTVYYTPYQGDKVPIFNGTYFTPTAFTELSQATTDSTKSPAAVAASKPYDLFVWNDAGTIRCTRGPAWTNDTTRGYTLTLTNGILLNTSTITNGPAASRGTYVGTIYSNASSQINDSALLRNVWNCYNRVVRAGSVVDTTNTWSYATSAWRQANASSANQVEVTVGLAEDVTRASVAGMFTGTQGVIGSLGVGIDSTTANSAQIRNATQVQATSHNSHILSEYWGVLSAGRHTIVWLEWGDTDTVFAGDRGGTTTQSGLLVWGMA